MDEARRLVRRRALVVLAFAVAMAYLEAACVLYLQRALGMTPAQLFPIRDASALGGLAGVEVGREAATLAMLWAVGALLGSDGLERMGWTSVAFGLWDVAYYGWLIAFLGWPTSLGTWDLLFLIPAPWSGPVWAPLLVSVALVAFGLAVPWLRASGRDVRASRRQWALLVLGGAVVVIAFLWNAPLVLDGGVPTGFPWPLFALGLAMGLVAAVSIVRESDASPVAPA